MYIQYLHIPAKARHICVMRGVIFIMKKLTKRIAATFSAAAIAATGAVSLFSPAASYAVDTNNDDWLHAVGSRLYDENGNEVWLTGANWFGFNCTERCPHYLYAGDCDDMLREVAERGINVIRFPISTELIYEWMNGLDGPVSGGGLQAAYNPPTDEDDGNGGVVKAGTYGSINKDFVLADGMTHVNSQQAFEIILSKCKKYGIKAFVDIHSPHADNSGHNYNLWYGKEMNDHDVTVTTDIWIETTAWLAEQYKNDDTLLGFDLKNEPHGKGQEGAKAAKWDGSTDENNWAYAAAKCADAVLDANPKALIFIEGVEQSLSGAQAGDYWGIADRRDNSPYIGAWWGGNFRGAREYPIKPEHGTSQIVYSPHDYGPSVYAQTWFEKDFTEQTLLDDYWYDTWAYINAEDIAPELIGEWGGHMDGAENQKWMELLRDYMINHHINHTFWCLNTNSGDTGGLWAGFSYNINDVSDKSNGTTITWEEDKYALFEKSLWQTQKTGKYIGLDHQTPLGVSGTGLSLNEFYEKYSSTEGSNLDGGTIIGGKPIDADTPAETTTVVTSTGDVTTATAATVTTVSENSGSDEYLAGDANLDGKVSISDAVRVLQYLANGDKYDLSAQAKNNADVDGVEGISGKDAASIQKFDAGIIKSLPEKA